MATRGNGVGGHPARWAILGVLILSESVVELDATIVNVALPSMARDLGAGTDSLQWIVDAYMLVFGGLLLVAGALGDRLGRRPVLMAGLSVFAVASILAAVSPTAGWLIASRALMGLGAAMILPTTLATLSDVFEGDERIKAFSIWSATAGLSFAVGPTAGGALVKGFGWEAIFLINLPIAAVALVRCGQVVPLLLPARASPPDWVGGALSILGLGMLLFAIIGAPKHGWDSGTTLVRFALAALLLAALIVWERRSAHPMVDLRLFGSSTFSASTVAIALQFLATAGALFVLTQYLQAVLGHSALGAGVRILPVAGSLLVAALASPAVEARIGTKLKVTIGLSFTTASLAVLSTLSPDTPYGVVALGLALAGIGGGLAITPAVTAMLTVISQRQTGSSAALNNAAVMVGSALGVAILGSLVVTRYTHELTAALPNLPADALAQARAGVSTAAQSVGDAVAAGVLPKAREAFVDAAAHTFLVASIIAAVGAAVAAAFLPPRVSAPPEEAAAPVMVAAPDPPLVDAERGSR